MSAPLAAPPGRRALSAQGELRLKPLPHATRLAARILGPLLIVGGAMLITQHARMLSVIDAFLENDGLMVMGALVSLVVGLAILVLHPFWRTLTSGFISLIGLLALAKGLLILFAPDLARQYSIAVISAPQILPIAGCVMALVGLWMLVVSILSPPSEDLGLI